MKSQTVSQKLLALKPSIRLTIGNPTAESSSLFGPGVAALCNGVQERGSLNAAAKAMGMAYSKAWKIVKQTEEALGFALLVRDGARGSALTAEGDALLKSYQTLNASLASKAEELYRASL